MNATNKTHEVVRQEWLESERGWGVRPDGYSLHRTPDDCVRYIKEYWAAMPDEVPDEYSRPDGSPQIVCVDEKTYQQVCRSVCGVRYY